MKSVSFTRTKHELPQKSSGSDKVVCASCRYALEEEFEQDTHTYQNPLSLDTLFVQHPAATYIVQVGNEDGVVAIEENKYLGITVGDILTIDRALEPRVGRIALIVTGGVFKLCRVTEHIGKTFLVYGEGVVSKNDRENNVQIWGVVSALSRKV